MNFAEAVRRSSSIRDEHKESLIHYLRKIPDFSWMLTRPNSVTDRLQGDFFGEFPVVYLKPDGSTASRKQTVMLINNTCDLPHGRSSFVTVAPAFDFARYLQRQQGKKSADAMMNHIRDLRHNQISELLYVPGVQGFDEGVIVRLDMMCSVAAEILDEAVCRDRRVASFSQNGFYVLLTKLIHHLGRMESPDAQRN